MKMLYIVTGKRLRYFSPICRKFKQNMCQKPFLQKIYEMITKNIQNKKQYNVNDFPPLEQWSAKVPY